MSAAEILELFDAILALLGQVRFCNILAMTLGEGHTETTVAVAERRLLLLLDFWRATASTNRLENRGAVGG